MAKTRAHPKPATDAVIRKALTERQRARAFAQLATAVGKYLESVGWRALVVGNPRVQQQFAEREFNYELVVRFTGGKRP